MSFAPWIRRVGLFVGAATGSMTTCLVTASTRRLTPSKSTGGPGWSTDEEPVIALPAPAASRAGCRSGDIGVRESVDVRSDRLPRAPVSDHPWLTPTRLSAENPGCPAVRSLGASAQPGPPARFVAFATFHRWEAGNSY